ncbi:MMPL family transporter [Actinocatenispora rupis]|uniref:Membrane transport protein MMPL domain-containing protein n=1 Tax=Actinocatenispora rupis TaxID=519421 RepID=A0A8J3J001_9ACTN|nr:MMPL family transporter [Actinocatenispora rupis]GID09437.1 hypothetical protein Aru02nite_03260 [Actinocatenispora rupis]
MRRAYGLVPFGLAMDYPVFLASRMHEAHPHGARPRDAIVAGFPQAVPVVLAAASIMFGVFAGFVPEGDATIRPIAFAPAAGVVLDAIVVRTVAYRRRCSAGARQLPRWLPSLDVAGAALERSAVAAEREPAGRPS